MEIVAPSELALLAREIRTFILSAWECRNSMLARCCEMDQPFREDMFCNVVFLLGRSPRLDDVVRFMIEMSKAEYHGNQDEMARLLGVWSVLRYKLFKMAKANDCISMVHGVLSKEWISSNLSKLYSLEALETQLRVEPMQIIPK
jgi:hypothetical protein